MSKSAKSAVFLLSFLMILCLGAELAVGWFAYQRLNETGGTLDGLRTDNSSLREELGDLREELAGLQKILNGKTNDPAQEDDVTIAGEYVIRSTLPISDAYRSGDRSALDDKQKETLDMAAAILEQIISPEMDDYEKEQAVYVWMTENLAQDEGLLPVIPRTQADCDNPYGVLKFHNAVCVGYATTFRMFMQMLDIPCMVVHNSECYHSWDLVQLNGGWYHTDIYSDAGDSNFTHFNLTDLMQGSNQSWNTEFFPAASSYEYCYAARASVEEKDMFRVPALVRKALDDREELLSLRFGSSMDETRARVVQRMLNDIQNRLDYSEYSGDLYMDWNWMPLDEGWLLTVNLNWYDDSDDEDEDISEEYMEKADEAVNDAFGDIEEDYDYDEYEDNAY